jgi:hypothetical protein
MVPNGTRRQLLKGAGVCLALPWLETFAPRTARAQIAAGKKRYVALYFPNGSAEYWRPTGEGSGDNWTLSPVLEPLAPVKPQLSVLGNVGYLAPLMHANPSHGQLCAAMWTCTAPDPRPSVAMNGTSVDQIIANAIGKDSPLPSLQVGLSTMDSFTDGRHPANSRSISWASPTQPLYKIVNPQAVFDRLVGGGGGAPTAMTNIAPMDDPAALRRRGLRKSALDYVLESSGAMQPKLGASDRQRVDEFMSSVRALEKRVQDSSVQVSGMCQITMRPPEAYAVGNVPANYSRDTHAGVMIDLVVMALQCGMTRVVSFMLDDARSDFAYIFLKERQFTATGSTPAANNVSNGNINQGLAGFHGLQHAGPANDGFATINYWLTEKANQLVSKLAASSEGAAGSVLDNTVVVYGSGMHGGNHAGVDLPLSIIGSGGGVLKKNTYFPWPDGQILDNVHLTIMQKVFGINLPSFAQSTGIISELLA